MTVMLSIDYPPISADKGEDIKGKLQEQDILADFGPGQTIWQNLFGKPKPDMHWANIIAPNWFQGNFDGSGETAPLTDDGKDKLNTTVQTIYAVASGPITVLCHKHGEKPIGQKELNVKEFQDMLSNDGLPYRTLIILDRRLEDR
ncbi:MAG: hypothetical protein DHS20C08_21850 [Rhodomicrobium sp.]|nr:MAG: hypothetical protein DHS20C08_21850 [Rhodomicrobium sp.]